MAKLRHIALQVPDLERAAKFYENALEMTRVAQAESPIGNAIMLSDGVMNLTLLHFPPGTKGQVNGPDWAGLHHFGFVVDDREKTTGKIEDGGGRCQAAGRSANLRTDKAVFLSRAVSNGRLAARHRDGGE